jgi:hypothetical protein
LAFAPDVVANREVPKRSGRGSAERDTAAEPIARSVRGTGADGAVKDEVLVDAIRIWLAVAHDVSKKRLA